MSAEMWYLLAAQDADSTWTQAALALGGAVIGAIVGGAIAIVSDRTLHNHRERERFENMMTSLAAEIASIKSEAESAQPEGDSGGLRQPAPLQTDVWRTVLSGGFLPRLSPKDLQTLIDFYRAVEAANHLAALAPSYLQTANLSQDDVVQDMYYEEARRVTTAPFDAVVKQAPTAAELAARYGHK